ncbi:hypothetical protein [Lichenibacterium ramalinae]|uniref:Uncharacterized protein n=1 Tax=Lichenibacterium ramalinae TaxID=2316527 RepID=A0A4Q2R7H8_9HYPH|nr:hypothetical protein [Lichenibacterium ramalinae]RYB01444.1 hypothetical protein D3272_26085 [Lichenibacterium ramalinae]
MSDTCAKPGKLLTEREFRELVEHLTPTELRRRFPHEENSRRDLIGRRLKEYRGCVVDPRWSRLKPFLLDVGQKPAADWTLDRKNPDRLEYGPGLVEWRRKRDQSANRACTILLQDADGTVRPLTEWAALKGLKPDTMRKNHNRRWSDPEVIAGRRSQGGAAASIVAAAPVAPPDAMDWPTGANAKWWEDGFRHFAAHFEAYGHVHDLWDLTRGAFFLWIGTNMRRALWGELCSRHAWCRAPAGDAPPEAVLADPVYRGLNAYDAAIREIGPTVYQDPSANHCLNGLQRLSKRICQPDDPSLPQLFVRIEAKRKERRMMERLRAQQRARWADEDDD